MLIVDGALKISANGWKKCRTDVWCLIDLFNVLVSEIFIFRQRGWKMEPFLKCVKFDIRIAEFSSKCIWCVGGCCEPDILNRWWYASHFIGIPSDFAYLTLCTTQGKIGFSFHPSVNTITSINRIILQLVTVSIGRQLMAVSKTILICGAFWLIFAIMGVQMFAGKFYKVNWPSRHLRRLFANKISSSLKKSNHCIHFPTNSASTEITQYWSRRLFQIGIIVMRKTTTG